MKLARDLCGVALMLGCLAFLVWAAFILGGWVGNWLALLSLPGIEAGRHVLLWDELHNGGKVASR